MNKFALLALSMSMLSIAQAQTAQPAPVVELFKVEQVTDASGNKAEKLTKTTQTKPGDIIERVITVKVVKTAQNANMTVPISVSAERNKDGNVVRTTDVMYYIANSDSVTRDGVKLVKGKDYNMTYSGDINCAVIPTKTCKGPWVANPTKVTTVTRDGKSVSETIELPVNEYRSIRYNLGTAVAGTYMLKHRVRIR